jgi:hypothetical protein
VAPDQPAARRHDEVGVTVVADVQDALGAHRESFAQGVVETPVVLAVAMLGRGEDRARQGGVEVVGGEDPGELRGVEVSVRDHRHRDAPGRREAGEARHERVDEAMLALGVEFDRGCVRAVTDDRLELGVDFGEADLASAVGAGEGIARTRLGGDAKPLELLAPPAIQQPGFEQPTADVLEQVGGLGHQAAHQGVEEVQRQQADPPRLVEQGPDRSERGVETPEPGVDHGAPPFVCACASSRRATASTAGPQSAGVDWRAR